MISAKSDFVGSIERGNHFLVVYEDPSERDFLGALFVEGALKRKDLIVMYTSDNDHILSRVNRKRGLAVRKAIAGKTLLRFNSTQAFGRPPQTSAYEKFFKGILQESRQRKIQISFLGEFPVESYDTFEVGIEIERFADSFRTSDQPTGLCLNKKNAIFHLDPKQLVSLMEAHDSILLEATPMGRTDSSVSVHSIH